MNYAFDSTYSTGQKATITVRVLGGDRPGTVFKMTARQAAPVILGNPKIISRGLTETLAPGQSIDVVLDIRQNREALIGGFCTLSKVYWDALGDGTVNDSTTDTNVLSWTWLTQVPAGALGQKRSVIVKAVDKNGLWSAPETLSVRFGVIADSVVDIDGNVYHTVKIGTQEWTMENLRVTRYNDGTAIPKDTSHATWHATTPKYCFFKNTTNADSIKKFGALYNWYVVDLSNPQKIAPAGWHVPSDSEWTVMEKYLITNGYTWDGTTTNNTIAKALAGQTDWIESGRSGAVGNNMTANNSSGFSALGAGYRIEDGFDGAGYFGYWWSTTVDSAAGAYSRNLRNNGDDLNKFGGYESSGFSVRLVRD
jgi:uncharacterized protein (TIGR02145 family)